MGKHMGKWFLAGCVAVAGLSAPRAIECVRNGIDGPYRAGLAQARRATAPRGVPHAGEAVVSAADARAAGPRDRR